MLNDEERKILKDIAYSSIEHGLQHGKAIAVDLSALPTSLSEQRATFVTLQKNGQLRGCIGMLEAIRPLAQDIAENAYAAAFKDPRFPELKQHELSQLDIHLSILSPAELIPCQSEAELIQQLRPNIDGLILNDGLHRATFLPSVWQSLTEPAEFIHHLKMKAGLSIDYWSEDMKAYRYTTESF